MYITSWYTCGNGVCPFQHTLFQKHLSLPFVVLVTHFLPSSRPRREGGREKGGLARAAADPRGAPAPLWVRQGARGDGERWAGALARAGPGGQGLQLG